MTVKDLMLKVKNALEAKGFECESAKFSNAEDFEIQAFATRDGKYWEEAVQGYTFKYGEGYKITFETVYRSNATDENVSVDIRIIKWHQSCGKRIAKERVNVKMGDKAFNKRIDNIVSIWETL